MIKIYGPKENNFTSNGIVAFKPFKLVETKKISLNGWYIDVAAPLQYEEHLKQDMLCVVKVKSKLKPQAFRIKDVKKTQRKIEFQAEHVMFDARNYFLLDVRAVNMSAVGALKYINERTDIKSPFSFTSDVNNSSTAYFIRKNLLEAMVTIEERWGGYFEADNWSVALKKSIGKDRGEVISYGKNLESIQVVEDWSNVVTKLYPVGFDGILLPEKYLESEIKYDQPYTKTVQFETEFEDEDRTEANLLPELRENAQAYIEKNQYPMVNYEIKSNINELMEIGDLIHVKHPLVDIQTTVQEYQYDILQNRVTSLVFGNYSRDVKKRFDAIKNDIKELKQNTSNVEAIIGNQTELINSLNKDGHIYIDDNQIMVLDKLPKENAKYVWRWNMGGLGFSENGIEGPFKQAWTIDGTFNTDFIAANSIMANQLHSDVGSSLDISSNESINLLSEKNKEIEGELSQQSGRLDVAYNKIEATVESINAGENIIPNLNGKNGTYRGWSWSNSKLYNHPRLIQRDGLRANTNFLITELSDSLSRWGLEFYSNGSAISPVGYVVPGSQYSFKGKRAKGSQSYKVIVHEYRGSTLNKSTTFTIGSGNYGEFSITPQTTSDSVRLEFVVTGVTQNNPLILTEMMFNRGIPNRYKDTPEDVKLYAKSQFTQLDNEIKSTVEEVKVVDGKTVKNLSMIQQLSEKIVLAVDSEGRLVQVELGVDAETGSYFVVRAENISLEGLTTINGGFKVLENGDFEANKGTVGGYTIQDDKLVGNDVTLGSNSIDVGNATLIGGTNADGKTLDIVSSGLDLYNPNSTFHALRVGGDRVIYHIKARGAQVKANSVDPDTSRWGSANIGDSANRWNNIYLKNQPNVSSDHRQKSNIIDIPDKLVEMFMTLEPKQYVQNNQVHFGYIAQDVEIIIFKYLSSTNKYNSVRELNEDAKRYAILYKDETFLSLLYGEIQVIKDAYYKHKIEQLEYDLNKLKKKPKVSKGFRKRSGR